MKSISVFNKNKILIGYIWDLIGDKSIFCATSAYQKNKHVMKRFKKHTNAIRYLKKQERKHETN